jgi:hypothetical protein
MKSGLEDEPLSLLTTFLHPICFVISSKVQFDNKSNYLVFFSFIFLQFLWFGVKLRACSV